MILTDEKLLELNNHMLNLGAPVDRDYSGYNVPDFAVMYNLAYIPSANYTDLYRYAIADRLSRYVNTQLSADKEDIIETKVFYEHKIGELPNGYAAEIKNANLLYRPVVDGNYVIDLVNVFNGKIEVHHRSRSQKELEFKNSHSDSVRFINRGTEYEPVWNTVINFEVLPQYLDLMAYKYVPSVDLANFVKNLEQYIKEQEALKPAEEKKTIKASLVEQDDNAIIITYKGFVSPVRTFVEENRARGIRWVKGADNQWNLKIPYKMLSDTKAFLESNGIDFSGVDYIPEETITERKLAESRNEYEMLDLSKLNLPFKPYDFQVEDIKDLMSRTRCLIGHDMGAGKTFISAVVGESIPLPKLVIVPESLRLNWRREISNINPNSDVKILYSKDKIDTFEFGKDWTICGYATVAKYGKELLEKNYQCVFVDEVHNCKAVNNSGKPSSKRAGAVMNIALQSKYCYLLTGTPIPTRNKDLYNILKMLKVSELDWNSKSCFFHFGMDFCDGVNTGFGWDFSGNSNSKALHDILAPNMIRRLKKDVLPNLTKQRIFVPMETHSRDYKAIEKDIIDLPEDKTYMGLAMSGRATLSKEKVEVAIDLANSLLEEGKSVVLVSNFTDTVKKIEDTYKDDCCMIVGGMSDVKKQKAVDDFQAGRKKVCALNIVAGGVGITLTKAYNMIIVDYDWTPALMSQVEDRICRSGQTEPCVIQYLYCENALVDRTFVAMITDKSANIDEVVDAAENSMDLSSGVRSAYENSGKTSEPTVGYMQMLKQFIKEAGGTVKSDHPRKKDEDEDKER